MRPKRLGVHMQELDGHLQIENFKETCTLKSATPEDALKFQKDDIQKCVVRLQSSCALAVGHGGDGFAVSIDWEALYDATKGGFIPDPSAKMGLRLMLSPDSNGTQDFAHLDVQLINTDARKNLRFTFGDMRPIKKDFGFGWGPSPYPTNSNSGFITLADVLNPSQGWLHDGTLRIGLKLRLVTQGQPLAAVYERDKVHAQGLMNLSVQLEALLQTGDHTDVIIKVNDDQLRVHSLILMARSNVFASMLTLPMREATERTVIINDLTTTAVNSMITFMYSGRIDEGLLQSDSDLLGILEAAHRYDVQSLVSLCVQSLCARLKVETAAEYLRVADIIGHKDLKAQCVEFIHLHLAEVQASSGYTQLVETRPAVLAEILALVSSSSKRRRVT